MEERQIVVSFEELREIEARYTPTPTFAEWDVEPPSLATWDRRVGESASRTTSDATKRSKAPGRGEETADG